MTVTDIIEKLKNGNLDDPKELSDFLVMLSATKLTSSTFETEARIRYAQKWLELKKVLKNDGKEKSDKITDMEAMITEEYREWKKMENANDAIQETIMALKKKLSTTIFNFN